MKRKLYKSSKNKKLAGVCGGLAEYLNIDVTVVRLIWAILSLFYGSGIIIYIICALVIPYDNIIDMYNEKAINSKLSYIMSSFCRRVFWFFVKYVGSPNL